MKVLVGPNVNKRFTTNKVEEDGSNGMLLASGVSLQVWNEMLQTDHRFKGMLWHEEDKVCLLHSILSSEKSFFNYVWCRYTL